MKKLLLLLIFGVFLINLISALSTYKQGDIIQLTAVCDNCTNVNLTKVIFPNGTIDLLGQFPMTKNGTNYNYTYSNTNTTGTYLYVKCGDLNGILTCQDINDGNFEITPSGESSTIATAVFYIGLLALLVIFFVLILFYGLDTENIVGKTFSIGFGYLLMIGIFFISWQMALSFIYSSPFLIDFFRIVFFVLMIGFFPLLLILFAYGSYMMLQIKEIKDMQERGISIDEINERKFGAVGRY